MGVNDASGIVIDTSGVMLQIVASLTDDSRSTIYNYMFLVEATNFDKNYFSVFLPLEQPTRQRTSVQAPEHGPAGRPGAIVLKNFLFSSLKSVCSLLVAPGPSA
jgi:hypothetical protein